MVAAGSGQRAHYYIRKVEAEWMGHIVYGPRRRLVVAVVLRPRCRSPSRAHARGATVTRFAGPHCRCRRLRLCLARNILFSRLLARASRLPFPLPRPFSLF